MSHPSARIEEVVEEADVDDAERSSGEDSGPEDLQPDDVAQSSTSKKKKKKRSKSARALQNLVKGKSGSSEIPQELVDTVLAKTKETHPGLENVDQDSVRKALEALKVMDVLEGKAGLGGRNQKEMGEYKVDDAHRLLCYLAEPGRINTVLENATSPSTRRSSS